MLEQPVTVSDLYFTCMDFSFSQYCKLLIHRQKLKLLAPREEGKPHRDLGKCSTSEDFNFPFSCLDTQATLKPACRC